MRENPITSIGGKIKGIYASNTSTYM